MATCCNASARVACDDGRPNDNRTCLTEACMLLFIKSRKICSSIFYIVYIFVYKV